MFQGQLNRLANRRESTWLIDSLPNDPDHILLGAPRNSGYAAWRANVHTGEVDLIDMGTDDTSGWATDGEGRPVLRIDSLPRQSGYRIFRRPPGARDWILVQEVRAGAGIYRPDFIPFGPGPGAGQVYVAARAQERDRAAIYLYDAATGAFGAPIYEHETAEAAAVWIDPEENTLVAACSVGPRRVCRAEDPMLREHFPRIAAQLPENVDWRIADVAGDVWLIEAEAPDWPASYSIYRPESGALAPVGDAAPQLAEAHLAPTRIHTFQTRDGQELWGYLTTPLGADVPAPLIMLPHGGPEARDYYEFDPFVQFLASRGYAVFQPQFRGSGGFGRRFAEQGYGQWGARMQNDVTDAAANLIASCVADQHRICIVGFSYGGYVALAGAAFTPDLYRCAVSIAGVSDLIAALEDERAVGAQSLSFEYWRRSIGDPRTDGAALRAISPSQAAGRIHIPVLLVHGADDEIVPARQSELMNAAMTAAGGTVRYVPIPEARHPFIWWSNEDRTLLFSEVESFLAQHLAPRAGPAPAPN